MKSIQYKNKIITYTVSKAKVNNLYISVQNGEVSIKAPWYVTSNQIQKALEEKREWICEKLEEYNTSPRATKRYIDGDKFQVLGDKYTLEVNYSNIKKSQLIVEDTQLKIMLPTSCRAKDNKKEIKNLIDKMYQMIAEQEIERAMEKMRILVKLAPEEYKIKKLIRSWGNCSSTKKITLNVDLAMYSRKAIEYVVLHEICHLKYLSHSKSFWTMVEKYMPEYKQVEQELKK